MELDRLQGCSEDEKRIMNYYFDSMPYSDKADVDYEVLLEYAKHALYLREHVAWCKELPENIFLTDVAAYRINNEKIVDCRKFFYDMIFERIKDLSIEEAILEVNYWCAENGTYHAADLRTASALTVYRSGLGRCGEESVFLVTALRSVGIPARQVYAPLWAHCDDNHAWVEVWFNGTWSFLGACEPEPVLNKGWFTGPASRAMLIHARIFNQLPQENYISKEGCVTFTNATSHYAKTKEFVIEVVDKKDHPIRDLKVRLEVLNYGMYGPIATMFTDEQGKVKIELGLGDLRVHLQKGDMYQVEKVSVHNMDTIKIIFTGEHKAFEQWFEYEMKAPEESVLHPGIITEEQGKLNSERMSNAQKLRDARIRSYYIKEKAMEYPEAEEIFQLSRGNFESVYTFLSQDKNKYRLDLLKVLTEKDLYDFEVEILEEHLTYACEYATCFTPEIFIPYILNPRMEHEELSCYRAYIKEMISDEKKEEYRLNPRKIWYEIVDEIDYKKELDYDTLRISPVGALKMKLANEASKKILFGAICRTLGIPARLNPINQEVEFYQDGMFQSLYLIQEKQEKATLEFHFEEGSEWKYNATWTIGKKENGLYETLDLEQIEIENLFLKLEVEAGEYQIIITTRTPEGNQLVREFFFQVNSNERKEISMQKRHESLEKYLVHKTIMNVSIWNQKDEKIDLKDYKKDQKKMVVWLEEGKEPTEHVLNEMIEDKELVETYVDQIILIVKDWSALTQATLAKALDQLKGLTIYRAEDWNMTDQIATKMDLVTKKYPLAVVIDERGEGIYGTCGYNVGSVHLMLQLLAQG